MDLQKAQSLHFNHTWLFYLLSICWSIECKQQKNLTLSKYLHSALYMCLLLGRLRIRTGSSVTHARNGGSCHMESMTWSCLKSGSATWIQNPSTGDAQSPLIISSASPFVPGGGCLREQNKNNSLSSLFWECRRRLYDTKKWSVAICYTWVTDFTLITWMYFFFL